MVENPPTNIEDAEEEVGSIPGSGRSPRGGNGSPLQHSCLENSMGRGAWWVTVHGIANGWTQLMISTYFLFGSQGLALKGNGR